MVEIQRVDRFRTTLGGEPHTGWLPPNAAIPLPTPIRNVELDLTIEADGDGYLLIFESRDGTVRGDTWHSTVANAHDAAERFFGVPEAAWRMT